MKNYILELAEKNKRNTGNRGLNDFRELKIETGISVNAEGSAKVQLGETIVIAGVKMDIGTPYPDTMNKGNLICTGELAPISDPDFEPGPPDSRAIELARVVDRGIRESDAVDFEKLCITEGEKVWNVYVDFYVLNNDGNLIDACGLAAIAALKVARMPKLNEEGKVVHGEWSKEKIPFKKIPIPTTFVKIGNHIMVDPDKDEEENLDARLTVTCSESEINALQKGGEGGLKLEEIELCLTKSFKIREKIVESIAKLKG
ncbi:RNA-binding protein [archaeon CG07_land_8_20_14_0_80_38_8]|nr:MAG: RNA-binding protein [archaeon CG07_land_8_20_14_0_80_38_8]PIU88902.1 MAG: RNA-binding protein [archaeon CG06_land_8_20_14_3_00_37_11]